MKTNIIAATLLGIALSACSTTPQKAAETKPAPAVATSPAPNAEPPVVTSPAAAPAETEAQKLDRIVRILASNSVYFDFDKAIIKQEYLDTIKKNYDALQSMPMATTLRLEGNCDERGSAEYNIALGQKRADAVRQALVALGVSEARIETISYGKEKPRCTEHDEQCWQQNRRVDFIAK